MFLKFDKDNLLFFFNFDIKCCVKVVLNFIFYLIGWVILNFFEIDILKLFSVMIFRKGFLVYEGVEVL